MPAGTTTYRSVGRTFLKAPKEEIETDLTDMQGKLSKTVESAQEERAFVQKQMDEAKKNLEELLTSNPVLGRWAAGVA